MSLRRVLRIALSLPIIILLWIRTVREWHERPAIWLIGSLALSVILLARRHYGSDRRAAKMAQAER